MSRLWMLGAVACVAVAVAGCGDAGPKTHTVSGYVTFEGVPVAEGRIAFKRTTDQKEWSGEIKDGAYEVACEEGEMKVEIVAAKVIEGKFDTTSNPGSKEPLRQMYIPKKYNASTTLTAKVGAGSTNFPFALTK